MAAMAERWLATASDAGFHGSTVDAELKRRKDGQDYTAI